MLAVEMEEGRTGDSMVDRMTAFAAGKAAGRLVGRRDVFLVVEIVRRLLLLRVLWNGLLTICGGSSPHRKVLRWLIVHWRYWV